MNESLTIITQCFGLNRTTQVQEKKRKTSNGTIGQKENKTGHGLKLVVYKTWLSLEPLHIEHTILNLLG